MIMLISKAGKNFFGKPIKDSDLFARLIMHGGELYFSGNRGHGLVDGHSVIELTDGTFTPGEFRHCLLIENVHLCKIIGKL